MAFWLALGTVVFLSIYYLATMNRANTRQRKRIDQIQKRLAEKAENEGGNENS